MSAPPTWTRPSSAKRSPSATNGGGRAAAARVTRSSGARREPGIEEGARRWWPGPASLSRGLRATSAAYTSRPWCCARSRPGGNGPFVDPDAARGGNQRRPSRFRTTCSYRRWAWLYCGGSSGPRSCARCARCRCRRGARRPRGFWSWRRCRRRPPVSMPPTCVMRRAPTAPQRARPRSRMPRRRRRRRQGSHLRRARVLPCAGAQRRRAFVVGHLSTPPERSSPAASAATGCGCGCGCAPGRGIRGNLTLPRRSPRRFRHGPRTRPARSRDPGHACRRALRAPIDMRRTGTAQLADVAPKDGLGVRARAPLATGASPPRSRPRDSSVGSARSCSDGAVVASAAGAQAARRR